MQRQQQHSQQMHKQQQPQQPQQSQQQQTNTKQPQQPQQQLRCQSHRHRHRLGIKQIWLPLLAAFLSLQVSFDNQQQQSAISHNPATWQLKFSSFTHVIKYSFKLNFQLISYNR